MKRIDILDYARFMAALAVLAYHYFFHGHRVDYLTTIEPTPWLAEISKYGLYGVHFFFLISGYVIFFSARSRTPGSFAAARASRLYPAFWVSVLLTSFVLTLWGKPDQAISVKQFLTNLTLVPGEFHQPYIDGVYWTLWWEAYFYVMVFVLITLMTGKRLGLFFLLWPLAMLFFALLGRPDLPFLGGYFPFFAAGALFAMLHEKPSKAVLFSLLVSLGMCLYQTVAFALNEWDEPAVVIALLLAQFLFFFSLLNPKFRLMKLPYAGLAGAMTYPLYLIHQQIGVTFMNHYANEQNKYWMFALLILMMFIAAFLIHYLVEKKLTLLWKWCFNITLGQPVDKLIACFTPYAYPPVNPVSKVDPDQAKP